MSLLYTIYPRDPHCPKTLEILRVMISAIRILGDHKTSSLSATETMLRDSLRKPILTDLHGLGSMARMRGTNDLLKTATMFVHPITIPTISKSERPGIAAVAGVAIA